MARIPYRWMEFFETLQLVKEFLSINNSIVESHHSNMTARLNGAL